MYSFSSKQQAISDKMISFGAAAIPVDDVLNEIFDMALPKDPNYIDLKDLINCGVGGTIMGILIDCRGIQTHDNRDPFTHDSLQADS